MNRTIAPLHFTILLLFVPACQRPETPTAVHKPREIETKLFTEVTSNAGIRHVHHKPILDRKLDPIMSWVASVGAAAAAGDFDNDGWMDLYVTNSHKGTVNFLYRNNRDGTFTDVAAKAGLDRVNGENGTSMDCVWGDYDNDGWADLYLVRWGNDALFRNNGDGTFTDVTARCFRKRDGSPGTDWANGNAAVFLDYNLDGRLDLYVGNYFDEIDLWNLPHTRIMHDSFEKARNAGRNYLYRQEVDGTFTEVAAKAGVDDPGWTLAVGAADINNDGWPDLYCADDFGPDQLYLNRGDGTFEDATLAVIGSDTKKGMNVDFGDFDNDGWLDIYVTNITTAEYLQEGNMLWHNLGTDDTGQLTLVDISLEAGVYDGGWGWGAKFFDADLDADIDLVSVNGFISAGEGNYWYDLASWSVKGQDPAEALSWPPIGDRSFSGYEHIRFWRNNGLQSFAEQAEEVGLDSVRDGRGVVCFDYDNDGDLDLFIANQGQPPHLYRNNGSPGRHWLLLSLQADPKSGVNRDAVGTRVTLVTSSGRQMRERDGGNGYAGKSDSRIHFGLGAETLVQLIEVRWPDGGLQYLENVSADRVLAVRQDTARYVSRRPMQPLAAAEPRRLVPASSPATPVPPSDQTLSELEQALRKHPTTFAAGYAYRTGCVAANRHDRAIELFKSILVERPSDTKARIELACAYIDKIPTCGGMAAVVSKGTLARKSLDELGRVISEHPDLWVAYFCRAMNHLHWPKSLLHSDDAISDFQTCLRLQRNSAQEAPYHVHTYVGLGDAYVKAGKLGDARRIWAEGMSLHPGTAKISDRLALTDDGSLRKFVEAQRNLEQPINTDLSFVETKGE